MLFIGSKFQQQKALYVKKKCGLDFLDAPIFVYDVIYWQRKKKKRDKSEARTPT